MTQIKTGTVKDRDPDLLKNLAARKGEFKLIGGSDSDAWNVRVLLDVMATLWTGNDEHDAATEKAIAAGGALVGIAPRDELEGMIAAQMLAAHNAAVESYRRAMIGEQTFEGRKENLNQANRLSRTFATLVETLNKHRGKGQQQINVKHVHVNEGGQAIVGNVSHPGGGMNPKTEDQPHAKQITDALEPTVRCEDAVRDPVPVSGDEER